MQLGTRWTVGAEPPSAVPAALRPQVSAIEASLAPNGPALRWTLTWLEGRPVAELDTGVIVTIDREGEITVLHEDDDVS